MRIAVMAHNLRVAGGLSVGRNVIASLSRVADDHEFLLLMPDAVGYEDVSKPSKAQCHYYQRKHGKVGQLLFERLVLPKLVRSFKPDVVWGLGNFALPFPGVRQAFLLHLPHLLYDPKELARPVWKPTFKLWLERRRLVRGLRATQLVFCQTQTAAERFRRVFDYQGDLAIMPNAVSKLMPSTEGLARPAVFDRLKGKFVLFCLTRFYVHKNLPVLLDVFREHGEALRDVVVLLTVRADQHKTAPAFIEQLDDPAVAEHLVNIGPVPQTELPAYFKHCDGMILPTVLESFSGTYLEAMKFERPILTSDLDFAREVCQDAARYFDPLDTASIRDAILDVKTDAKLRCGLVAAGRRQLDSYARDWDDIVDEAVGHLQRLAGIGGGAENGGTS